MEKSAGADRRLGWVGRDLSWFWTGFPPAFLTRGPAGSSWNWGGRKRQTSHRRLSAVMNFRLRLRLAPAAFSIAVPFHLRCSGISDLAKADLRVPVTVYILQFLPLCKTLGLCLRWGDQIHCSEILRFPTSAEGKDPSSLRLIQMNAENGGFGY
ncbi:hypothetical protein E2320_015027 [Naja naja]|nr:hypothetical protein E2320_015027 [Naja naja]